MAKADITLNSAGVRDLLHDPGVVADLLRRGQSVARAAGGGVSVVADREASRTVVRVIDSSRSAVASEARSGRLARALDAAR